MARFAVQVKSPAALAADTGFGWIMSSATAGFKLRRMTVGVVAGATTPTSQQVTVGINRVNANAGTTPVAGNAIGKLDPNSGPALSVWNISYATPPTATAVDQYRVTFNSQSGVDLPWELLEEFAVSLAVTNGLGFYNRDNALPASHSYVMSLEWEE